MKFKQFLKRKIAPFLLASSIALSACGDNLKNTFTIDSVPSDSEITQIVKDINEKRTECIKDMDKCDKDNYFLNSAKLAVYVVNKQGIDTTPLCIFYDKDNISESDRKFNGKYFSDSECIWVKLIAEGSKPSFIINAGDLVVDSLHELGHKVHHKMTGDSDLSSESVSEFFQHYFNALGHTLFDSNNMNPYDEIFGKKWGPKAQFPVNDKCPNSVADDCRYEAGIYLQYKEFGRTGGNFNQTLDILVNYKSVEDTVDEFKRDIQNESACDYMEDGITEYQKFVDIATNGGYISEKGKNLSSKFFKIDSCSVVLQTKRPDEY